MTDSAASPERRLLEVRGLSKRDPQDGRRYLLDHIDFKIGSGESWALMGATGSGKSTLLRALVGLETDLEGEVLLDGVSILAARPKEARRLRRSYALVFQDPGISLDPRQTVLEAVAEPVRCLLAPTERSEARDRAATWLDRLEVPRERWSAFPHALSGGERQRVALARVLALEPRMLLVDEPASALDPALRREVVSIAQEWSRDRARALLWADHHLGTLLNVAANVAVLLAGRIVEVSSTLELLRRPAHPWTEAVVRTWRGEGVPQFMKDFPWVGSRGCAWAGTCSRSGPRCREERPALSEVRPGHRVACFDPVARGDSDSAGGVGDRLRGCDAEPFPRRLRRTGAEGETGR